jgi:hypothetical protein
MVSPLLKLLLQHMWQEIKGFQKKKNKSKPIVMLAVHDT